MRRIRLSFALALGGLLVLAAVAFAGPKRGYYIDPKLQTYIITTKDVSAVKSFQSSCSNSKGAQGNINLLHKKIKLNRKGGFSYTGKVSVPDGSGSNRAVSAKITATFKGGKFRGTAKLTQPGYDCAATFTARYYGVNPQG